MTVMELFRMLFHEDDVATMPCVSDEILLSAIDTFEQFESITPVVPMEGEYNKQRLITRGTCVLETLMQAVDVPSIINPSMTKGAPTVPFPVMPANVSSSDALEIVMGACTV